MELQILFESYIGKYGHKTVALFHALKDGMISGRIPAGSKLPSSRQLADLYGLSRGTVNVAYEMLHSQGYVRSETGRGTFAVYHDPTQSTAVKAETQTEGWEGPADTPVHAPRPYSAWGSRVDKQSLIRSEAPKRQQKNNLQTLIHFSLGKMDMAHFPAAEWNRLMYEQVRRLYDSQMGDAYETEGHRPLREAIAMHLRRTRGIAADTDDVVIVNGSQQAITLLIQLLIDQGDVVYTENPLYRGVRRAIEAVGGRIVGFPVDRDGIRFDPNHTQGEGEGEPAKGGAASNSSKLLVVTPGRQFPTGAMLAMERRLSLLEWAEANHAWIIEDDYDSEFRFRGRPIEPLKALDRSGRVAFIGTFSRTLMQDIRIGYAVLPPTLKDLFRKAKQLYDTHPSSILEQRALAIFMGTGLYERHLRRMRRIYKRRAELLAALLKHKLSALLDIHESEAGLHIYALWKRSAAELDRYIALSAQYGVRFDDMRSSYLGNGLLPICFGFAHLEEEQLREGVDRLVHAAYQL